ncbi:MAG: UDP-N-acetylmuramoyl-L-alanine--D-glutamate ligase [Cyclobacteriaceae bacterium]
MSKKVTIVGAGESGTGAALLAKAKGYEVFVSDSGAIKSNYKAELLENQIQFEEGKHSLDKLLQAKLVVKSPGIPDKAEVVQKARERNIEIIDEIEFAFRFLNGRIIAITGTNGKTTTTLLTYHLMKSAGLSVALAGNVGESLARKVIANVFDWFVIEISSYQIDGTITFRPDVAILLNITPDHLDRYEYQFQNYVNSKFSLLKNTTLDDYFIYHADDTVVMSEVRKRNIKAKQLEVSLRDASASAYAIGSIMHFKMGDVKIEIDQKDTSLKGPHNLINTMAAVTAAHLSGVSFKYIKEGLKNFKNAPHRLESIAKIRGVEFINDSKATNVDAVIYALGSFDSPLIWIAGGVDKGNDYNLLKDQVVEKVKSLICLGKENEKLKKYFEPLLPSVSETQSVRELVRMALKNAAEGDVVLLSPACASFDLFKNYMDRGDQFREAVLELKQENENSLAL